MANGNEGRYGPRLTWAGVGSAGLLFVACAVAVGTLIQNQINSVATQVDHERGERLAHFEQERSERKDGDTRTQKQLDGIYEQLIRRRAEFVEKTEFGQFQGRFTGIEDRVKILEATRPTAETLQQVGTSAQTQINELKERLRALENNRAK